MPRLKEAMKDVAGLRYASGRCLATFDPKISEWGNPVRLNIGQSLNLIQGSAPGEVKHLSTRRKRKQAALFFICSNALGYMKNRACDFLSSGERKGISPNLTRKGRVL